MKRSPRETEPNKSHEIIPLIGLSWLGSGVQEIHMGQKVNCIYDCSRHRIFPNLVKVGIECYNPLTNTYMCDVFEKNKTTIKEVHLAIMRNTVITKTPQIQQCTIIGYYALLYLHRRISFLEDVKTLHCFGEEFAFFENDIVEFAKKYPHTDYYYSFEAQQEPKPVILGLRYGVPKSLGPHPFPGVRLIYH